MTLFNIQLPNIPWLSRRRHCLLLVEDNAIDAALIRDAVQELGWELDIAGSAEMAEGFLHSRKYPVILVDMRLPGMPGWTLVAGIIQQYPESFVVAMPGEPADLAHMPRGIFCSFLIKPDIGQSYGPALRRLFRQAKL
jgi:CheY-like chemotaxis protein